MSKKKFAHSEIPYAQRLQMQKFANIAAHRDEAAMIAMQIACVALNDTEGLGYQRLSRFAKRQQILTREYYSDPEVGAAHLATRLQQLGFIVKDGKMYVAEDPETGEIVATRNYREQVDAGE